MSIVLPVAMLGATVLGGIGIYVGLIDTEEKGSIKLSSGQRIYVGSEVRLSEATKNKYPDSCLQKKVNGRVTSVDTDKRTVKFSCGKGISEELPADALDIVSSGINAVGISIPGGYLIEGSQVRLLQSARAKNRGKGLASPFANSVGVVTHINPKRKTEVMVRTERLDNSKGSFEEIYDVEDLEFVSAPSSSGKLGTKGGMIGIGSTVQLKRGPEGRIDPEVLKKHSNPLFGKASESYRLTGQKHKDAMGITRDWETFGTVTRVLANPDPKVATKIATVRCVSKDTAKSVVEEDYDINDLEAIPARSIPRPGIPIFGGMANNDIKVRLRAERKDAVASKPLGRPTFGDEGTVVDIAPTDKDNLKVLVLCNGKNPEELTKEWYEPEDLEIAEPDDTEGEAVFGGRVTVGSTIRIRQSARGKKCLGTTEVGDIGMVKGIDPNAADNLRINATCGRSMSAKQSEWYDPRDLEVFFQLESSGSELDKAQAELQQTQRELAVLKTRPEAPDLAKEKELETKITELNEKVKKLLGETVDKNKMLEVYRDTKEKLEDAEGLKREIESMRNKASKETTCSPDGKDSEKYQEKVDEIYNSWVENKLIFKTAYNPNEYIPIGPSNQFKAILAELITESDARPDPPTDEIGSQDYEVVETLYWQKTTLDDKIRKTMKNSDVSPEERYANMQGDLERMAYTKIRYDKLKASPLKSWYDDIDRKFQKLQELAYDIQTHAYSGNTPTEKLLGRIQKLINDKKEEAVSVEKKLEEATDKYDKVLLEQRKARLESEIAKNKYDEAYRKDTGLQKPQNQNQKQNNNQQKKKKGGSIEKLTQKDIALIVDYIIQYLTQPTIQIDIDNDDYRYQIKKAIKDDPTAYDTLRDYTRIAIHQAVWYEYPPPIEDAYRKVIEKEILEAVPPEYKSEQAPVQEPTGGSTTLKDEDIDKIIDMVIRLVMKPRVSPYSKVLPLRKNQLIGMGLTEIDQGKSTDNILKKLSDEAAAIVYPPAKTGNDDFKTQREQAASDTYNQLRAQLDGVIEHASDSKDLLDNLNNAVKNYLKVQKVSLSARKDRDILSGEATCLRLTLQAAEDLEIRTKDIVSKKCTIVGEADGIMDNVEDLIAKRKQAFLAAQTAFDPTLGEGKNAVKFLPPIGTDYDGRIKELESTLLALNTENKNTLEGFADLVNLCGEYDDDKLLEEAIALVNLANEGKHEEGSENFNYNTKTRKLDRELKETHFENLGITPKDRERGRNEYLRKKGATDPLIKSLNAYVSPDIKRGGDNDSTFNHDNPMITGNAPPEPRQLTQFEKIQGAVTGATDTVGEATKSAAKAVAKGTTAAAKGIARGVVTVWHKIPISAEARAKAAEIKKEKRDTNKKIVARIFKLSKVLAEDQILRLKTRTAGRAGSLDLARQLTIDAESIKATLMDMKMDLQFKLSNINQDDLKVSSSVDYYTSEMKKLKTCVDTSRATATEVYNKAMEEIKKTSEETETKFFEVSKPQQGQQGKKDYKSMTDEDLQKEIVDLQQRSDKFSELIRTKEAENPKAVPEWRRQKQNLDEKRKEAVAERDRRKTGGQRRRFTMRQPRRFHGY